ncbi:hypothetical protein PR048_002962 [Dryococelus australis]|uniref:DDE Tnp4 domain-containing protein n=1 Tax=Dryococelus australis TaxID=614101 RepID=A0ABQ9ILN4_9NEOP|nr:hypothetical protein PR048_002962 [Dryococelus australis]
MEGWRSFPGSVILRDPIYPLKSWLIPPIVQNNNRPEQHRFGRAHKKTRRVIGCAIGILKERFPCLNYLRLEPVFACKVVKCCVALCNLSEFGNEGLEVENDMVGLENIVNGAEGQPNDVVDDSIDVLGQKTLNYFYRHYEH